MGRFFKLVISLCLLQFEISISEWVFLSATWNVEGPIALTDDRVENKTTRTCLNVFLKK